MPCQFLELATLSLGLLLIWLTVAPQMAPGGQAEGGGLQWRATTTPRPTQVFSSAFSTPSGSMKFTGRQQASMKESSTDQVVCASWKEDSRVQHAWSPEESREDHSIVIRRDDSPGDARGDFAGRSQRIAMVNDPFEEPMHDPFEEPEDDLIEVEENPATDAPDADSLPDVRSVNEAIDLEMQRRGELREQRQSLDTNPTDPFVEGQVSEQTKQDVDDSQPSAPASSDTRDSKLQIVEPDDLETDEDHATSLQMPGTIESETSGVSEAEVPFNSESELAEDYNTDSEDTGSGDMESSNARDYHIDKNSDQNMNNLEPYDEPLPQEYAEEYADEIAEEFAENAKNCAEEIAALKSARIDSIDLNINIRGNPGKDYPFECSLDTGMFQHRRWPRITYMWKAAGLCHKPLYFEQVHLERYGHSWGPYLQPIVSGAHFFATIPILPYKMGLKTPNECVYTLGYYRPGSCAPFMIEPIGFTWRAALFEAGAMVGTAAAIP